MRVFYLHYLFILFSYSIPTLRVVVTYYSSAIGWQSPNDFNFNCREDRKKGSFKKDDVFNRDKDVVECTVIECCVDSTFSFIS